MGGIGWPGGGTAGWLLAGTFTEIVGAPPVGDWTTDVAVTGVAVGPAGWETLSSILGLIVGGGAAGFAGS